jgi:GAF domain-containing protein
MRRRGEPLDLPAGLLGALRDLAAPALAGAAEEDVIAALTAATGRLVDADQVHVIEVSQDAAVGQGRVTATDAAGAPVDAYVQVFDERPSGVATVVATREPLHVPDARTPGLLREDYVERFAVASALFVPLIWDDEVRFVVVALTHAPREFSEQEIELARLTADIAATGLALGQVRRTAEARHDRDAALARAARALDPSQDRQTVLETLAREAGLAVAADMAGVYLGDGVRGGVATAGWNTPPEWFGYLMQPGEGVGGQTLLTGRPAISNAYQSDVRVPANPALQRLQTAVSVPVTWGGELKGALSIGFRRMRRVTQEDLRTLQAIADLAAIAIRDD